jgi:hypothetical protein
MPELIPHWCGCQTTYMATDRNVLGLECEVESIAGVGGLFPGWTVTDDGSLRNNGKEFLSGPKAKEDMLAGFRHLHTTIRVDQYPKFSDRTSIHVHANCQNLTTDQVVNIIKMYALYEEMFFYMCEPHRRHNIHCVPLTETYLPALYSTGLSNMLERWHKYTALNIKRLSDLGTIEFRHMEGHDDVNKLNNWLTIIENLFNLAKTDEGKITKDTLTNANLEIWFSKIFSHTPEYSKYQPLLREMTAHQRIDLKLAVL